EIGQRRAVSESVAERVDAEMKRLLDEAYDTAMSTLEENRTLLERIAEALLERETLDREEIDLLAAGEELPEARIVRQAREVADPRGGGNVTADAPQANGESDVGGGDESGAVDEAGTADGGSVAVADEERSSGT